MRKQVPFLVIAVIVTLFVVINAFSGLEVSNNQQPTVEEVKGVAQTKLPQLVTIIKGDVQGFGFENNDAVEHISLGPLFPMYQFDSDKLRTYQATQPSHTLLSPIGRWAIPILHKGNVVGVGIVGDEGNGLQFIGFGADRIYGESLMNVHQQYQKVENLETVNVFGIAPLHATFAFVQNAQSTELILLNDGADQDKNRYLHDLEYGHPYSLVEIVPYIEQELRRRPPGN